MPAGRPRKTDPNPDAMPKVRFQHQAAQTRLFKQVSRNGGTYLEIITPQSIEVGGQRSGKTQGKLVFGVNNYCLKFAYCDILVLRRKFNELEAGPIQDFLTVYREFIETGRCTYNSAKHIATFANGSRVVFGGCLNNKDKDIESYLGQAYPYILVDECAQFSPDAWELLYARNTINAGCEADQFGNYPIPAIVGCTNPIGPFWDYYHTLFAKHAELNKAGVGKGEPFDKPEDAKQSKDGSWWVPVGEKEHNEWNRIYDPSLYGVNHSTMLDNLEYQKRDPHALSRLRSLSPERQKKLLFGFLDKSGGQYFEAFSPMHHVVDLRDDPLAIIWEPYQPIWAGQDWGVGHHNAFYLFTRALVRKQVGEDYVRKIVCIAEVAPDTTGQTDDEIISMINFKSFYPRLPQDHPQYLQISGKRAVPHAIYFSHEKGGRVMEKNTPAHIYSMKLNAIGFPSVTLSTRDVTGSTMFMYNTIRKQELVILSTCSGIISSIPQLQIDTKNFDRVVKTNSKSDDRFDAFRYGLFGELGQKPTPKAILDEKYAKTLDPFVRHFYEVKKKAKEEEDGDFVPQNVPLWQEGYDG